MKGTAMFGGMQVFNILIALLRSKMVALFLGPSGMGVAALFNSTANIIIQIAGLGLNLSIVKEVAAETDGDGNVRLANVKIARRWLWACGFLGALIAIAASGFLSRFTFGSTKYGNGFIWLSLMIFFSILSSGEMSFLQGGRKLKSIAIATLSGAAGGLLASFILYNFYGEEGIVPAMILSAFIVYIVNVFFSRRFFSTKELVLSLKDTWAGGSKMVQLGVVLMLASVIGSTVAYLINTYIGYTGGIKDVGYFQAASSITNQYVGLIFSAMAVDYLPRLAAINDNKEKLQTVVNQQAEIIVLIVTPLIMALMVTASLVIHLLLTKDFIVIAPLLRWMALGMFFKAVSFTLGYISFSKGDKKTFFLYEAVYAGLILLLSNIFFMLLIYSILILSVTFL